MLSLAAGVRVREVGESLVQDQVIPEDDEFIQTTQSEIKQEGTRRRPRGVAGRGRRRRLLCASCQVRGRCSILSHTEDTLSPPLVQRPTVRLNVYSQEHLF